MSHTMNLLYVTYSSIWNLLQLLYMRDRRGETAIDDSDDGNDNDDHNLPSVYLSIDPTIYPSITVIHLSLSVWYSHSYDVIPYRDAIYLSIYHIYLSMCIYHIYPSNIYKYLSFRSFMSIYHIYHIYLS